MGLVGKDTVKKQTKKGCTWVCPVADAGQGQIEHHFNVLAKDTIAILDLNNREVNVNNYTLCCFPINYCLILCAVKCLTFKC